MENLLEDLKGLGGRSEAAEPTVSDQALNLVLEHFSCPVGTIHVWNSEDRCLHLRAQRGMPEAILEKVTLIPIGKGMAGLAAQNLEPVQVCNLQTDDSGKAKPGAKLTQMEGSIALPMIVDGELRGTLGVAKPVAYEFTREEIDLLMRAGEQIGTTFRITS